MRSNRRCSWRRSYGTRGGTRFARFPPRDLVKSAAAERYPLYRDTVLERSGRIEPDYLGEVKAIVSELRGEPLDRLTATTRLAHDLAIECDDAEAFLPVFSSRLHVDLPEFEVAQHFSG